MRNYLSGCLEKNRMKKVIFNSLYYQNNQIKAPNMKYGGVESYIKNSFVSLVSAKRTNPDADVAFVSNNDLPEPYAGYFLAEGIKVFKVPFSDYTMPENFKWGYAFYKLNALKFMTSETNYDIFLELDTDTMVTGSLDTLWEECGYHNPVLFPLGAALDASVRQQIIQDYRRIFNADGSLIHYGGEFICSDKTGLGLLLKEIDVVYDQIKKDGFAIHIESGDEAIISMAAYRLTQVGSAAPYIRRYWTRFAYYSVDTNWNDVAVWHLPSEKHFGLLRVFQYYMSHHAMPNKKRCARWFNMPFKKTVSGSMLRYYANEAINRVKR